MTAGNSPPPSLSFFPLLAKPSFSGETILARFPDLNDVEDFPLSPVSFRMKEPDALSSPEIQAPILPLTFRWGEKNIINNVASIFVAYPLKPTTQYYWEAAKLCGVFLTPR
jgi:hypothetical protein